MEDELSYTHYTLEKYSSLHLISEENRRRIISRKSMPWIRHAPTGAMLITQFANNAEEISSNYT